ncbi:MAG: YraN family protein [Ruminococcaceae bacterium]|nr:YraN family protein [Oscillospiraceae bacterium]
MKAGETGRYGEAEASRYLEEHGYRILMRNYRSRYGEIDLVAEQDDTAVFVEVKTRRDAAFADAAQAVGPSKQDKLRKTALFWFQEFGERNARFDVIEVYTGTALHTVLGESYAARIRHIENAF